MSASYKKEVVVMGVYLGQLPPAELARLKAELAETLIAHFCYPRFFDYRTGMLRTRPVDRAKRQEVWLYLSSVDFTAWNRVDLMSLEFQHQIERLLIHFVQRNRNFFGEQGRKRMSDVRMLISASATSVVQGMRGHLTGHRQNNPPFGSPRPVVSWSTTNVTGRIERSWDQTAPATMLLQQQLQEVRGEIFTVPQSEARPPATAAPKRNPVATAPVQPPTMSRPTNGKRSINGASQPPVPKTSVPDAHHTASPPVGNTPISPAGQTVPAAHAATLHDVETAVTPLEIPVVRPPTATRATPPVAAKFATPEKIQPSPVPSVPEKMHVPVQGSPVPVVERTQPSSSSAVVQSRPIAATQSPAAIPPVSPSAVASQREQAPLAVSEEDMAIFEQLRHQLIVWLRIEVVRSGKDIAGQGPLQLLELLRQHENVDETRLQVVSSLLNLSNQVIKNGQATLLDYKQALTFHLIHTGR
jgi:hypothetical protein